MAYFYIILKLVSVIESMRFYKIPAGSLIPTIIAGDWIVSLKVWSTENLKRRDMIVFPFPPDPSIDYIKRVIGLPGERLEISKDLVFINGEFLMNPMPILNLKKKLQSRLKALRMLNQSVALALL